MSDLATRSTLRVFLAHPKGLSESEIAALVELVHAVITRLKPDALVRVVTGFEDWTRSFKACGSWDAWTKRVGSGVSFTSREPLYHAIVVAPSRYVGHATKEIVLHAAKARKPIGYFDGAALRRVVGIHEHNDRDYKAGWELKLDDRGRIQGGAGGAPRALR